MVNYLHFKNPGLEICALLFFIVMSSIDAVSSLLIWNLGGEELNPLMPMDFNMLILLKIIAIALIICISIVGEIKVQGSGPISVWGAVVVTVLGPVLNNMNVLLHAGII